MKKILYDMDQLTVAVVWLVFQICDYPLYKPFTMKIMKYEMWTNYIY